jgi:hypothetical protein
MSENDDFFERWRNYSLFNVPMTDKEIEEMSPWPLLIIILVFIGLIVGIVYLN